MASVIRKELLAATALTATSLGSEVTLEMGHLDFLAYQRVSANNGTTTVTTVIEHSPDGTTWLTAGSFTAVVNVTSTQALTIDKLFPHVRHNAVLSGGPLSATVEVALYMDRRK